MRRIFPEMKSSAVITLLVLLLGFAQIAPAQAPTPLPLSLENNYMVTGDYVVGGWMKTGPTTINGTLMSTGTIKIPDLEAYGNQNVALQQVPQGADIVAAYLYWEAVENSGVHSGQNGFFSNGTMDSSGNLVNYPIIGTQLGNPNAPVSWSAGGCTGSSQGSKTIVTYRAEVSGLLPIDPNGNVLPNTTYQVSLPDSGFPSVPPFAEGATLVIIYRLLTSAVPLNAVVIYDGAFAPSNQSSTVTQPIIGFFQAGNDLGGAVVSKITHIVANGQKNKTQNVYLNNVNLPSLYTNLTPLPGHYNQSWDNPTWLLPNGVVNAGDASATTKVVPTSNSKGCVTWAAIIMSTTVQDSDQDGLLNFWKKNQGYYDAGANRGMSNQGMCTMNQGACILKANDPSWVSLSGATQGEQDVFIQLDYMCTQFIAQTRTCDTNNGVSYKPDPNAISNLVSAFSSNGHKINVHIVPDDNNPILAQLCADTTDPTNGNPVYCPHPAQAGVVDWKSGYAALKGQPMNYPDETSCDTQTPPNQPTGSGPPCVRRFPPGQNNSYHEAIFAVASATPNWYFLDGSLTCISTSANTCISAPGSNTLTFTTSAPHGLAPDPTNTGIPNGRITVSGAISNPGLNGTYLVQSVCPGSPSCVPNTTSFTIQLATATAAPTKATDPALSVTSSVVLTGSGVSDIGGADSLISLGLWGTDGQTVPVESGTFMHELGHSLGLAHGGLYRTDLGGGVQGQLPDNYSFSFEPNCKPNYQSVMSYLFQVDLLDGVLDYSEQGLNTVNTLNESLPSPANVLDNLIHPTTMWYAPNQTVGSPATAHCDGSPLLPTDPPSFLLQGPASSITWAANQDINFDGKIETALQGYDDWTNLLLDQVGASGNDLWAGGAQQIRTIGGAQQIRTIGGEATLKTFSSNVRKPKGVSAALAAANTIQVNITAPDFGQSQIASFNIYREVNDAGFGKSAYGNLPVTQPLVNPLTFPDPNVSCGTYSYFVTTVLSDGRESVPSNTASATPVCSTTVTVTSSVSPSTFGQAVTFTATVTDTTNTATPTGSVQFSIDGAACGGLLPLSGAAAAGSAIATLTVSSASCTTTLAVNGGLPHTVKAVYSNADGSFNGSSGTVSQIVNPAPTSTALSSSVNASIYGQSVTFTATVANAAGASISTATPTGSVQFSIDGGPFGAAVQLSGSGSGVSVTSGSTATLTVKGSPHTVKAVYSPSADGNFIGSSGTLNQNVNPAPTSTSVSSSVNPSISGQSVTFTATVANTAGAMISTATPTGSVQFMDGAAPLGTAQIVSGLGTATLTTSALTVGTHPITAVYSNSDGNFLGNTSNNVNQLVQGFTITVSPSAQTISSGHQAMYTITVTPQTGLIGTIALSCSGAPQNATCSVSPLNVSLQGGKPITSTVTLSSNQNVNHGTFTLTITGTLVGGSLTNSATMQLTVKGNS